MSLSRDVSVGLSTAAPSRIHGEECSCLPASTLELPFDDNPDVQRLVILLASKLGWKGFVPAAIGMEGTQESFRSASAYIHANILNELPRKTSRCNRGCYCNIAPVSGAVTLAEVVSVLADKYDVEVPLVDLFMWGRPGFDTPALKSAIDIGSSDIGEVTCEHYAYRQEDLDWQVWIQKGDHPLPRTLVLTTTTDEARPQHTSVLTWNLAPSYNETSFTFDPPPGTHKITLASVKAVTQE